MRHMRSPQQERHVLWTQRFHTSVWKRGSAGIEQLGNRVISPHLLRAPSCAGAVARHRRDVPIRPTAQPAYTRRDVDRGRLGNGEPRCADRFPTELAKPILNRRPVDF